MSSQWAEKYVVNRRNFLAREVGSAVRVRRMSELVRVEPVALCCPPRPAVRSSSVMAAKSIVFYIEPVNRRLDSDSALSGAEATPSG